MTTTNQTIYSTWDEAFRALHPKVRQQSVRVAAYTEVLFMQACNSSFGSTEEGIYKKNAELAYKCALYHQIGKSLLPLELQLFRKDFSGEELAQYHRYTTDGRTLVAKLQEQTLKSWLRTPDFQERPTDNKAWLMIRETAQQHMEHWDGTGYPDGRKGNEISAIAQIVGLAKELDRLVSEVKSEAPFEEAMSALAAQSNKAFSEELIKILMACRGKCRSVYQKYILYTQTLTKTIPLVEKRKDRPMGLSYRPIIRGRIGNEIAYEAVPWFKGNLDNPDGVETLKDMEGLMHRTNLTDDMTFYFLYEAADTVLRLQNCKLPCEGVMLPIVKEFYTTGSKMPRLRQMYEDQPIDKRLLCFTVPQEVFIEMNDVASVFIKQLVEEGIPLVVDEYDPDQLAKEKLQELGIYNVRLSNKIILRTETANAIAELKSFGFRVFSSDADDEDTALWLEVSGADFISGTMTGELMNEETLIQGLLAKERENG